MFAYSNDGKSFRAVDPDYQAAPGEMLFEDYASPEQLAAAFPNYGRDIERAKVLKSAVQARIIEAGKMPAAYAALTQNPVYFARWFAPDHPAVYCDDPDAVALVRALGLDPAVILAAEEQQ